MHFTDNLVAKIAKTSPIVLGIDPNFDLMDPAFLPKNNSKNEIRESLLNFCRTVIDATYDLVPAIKPQSAYFEQFGSVGLEVLSKVLKYAKSKGLLVILDVKRGDIGSTSQAYANAFLADSFKLKNQVVIQNDLISDCITVNPFLGLESIQPFVETAIRFGKGLFVLVKTSNPGSGLLQDIKVEGCLSVSQFLATKINEWNQQSLGKSGFGLIGAVVGSTYPEEAKRLRSIMPKSIFLIPGTGSQGGSIKSALSSFDQQKKGGIIPISRSIIYPKKYKNLEYSLRVRKTLLSFIKDFEG